MNLIDDIVATSSAELLAEFPADMPAMQRNEALQQFESGRAHIVYTYTLKLSHFSDGPWQLFKLAHPDLLLARSACQLCLDSSDTHPRLLKLQSPPLKAMVGLFLENHHANYVSVKPKIHELSQPKIQDTVKLLMSFCH